LTILGKIKATVFIVAGLLLILSMIPNILHREISPTGLCIMLIGVFVAHIPVAGIIVENYSRRCYSILAMAGYGVLILCLIVMAVLTVIMVSASHDNPKNIPKDAAVIVPGCLLQGDIPGEMLQNRLNAAESYLEAHPSAICVVTGGYIGKYTQAGVMKKYLVSKGIAASRILVDDKSNTTYENISNAKKLLGGKRDVVITTDVFHEYRSKFYARRLGLNPYAVPSITPARHYIDAWCREYLAVLKAWILKV
jgi:vancomycin permeability regulator SanA